MKWYCAERCWLSILLFLDINFSFNKGIIITYNQVIRSDIAISYFTQKFSVWAYVFLKTQISCRNSANINRICLFAFHIGDYRNFQFGWCMRLWISYAFALLLTSIYIKKIKIKVDWIDSMNDRWLRVPETQATTTKTATNKEIAKNGFPFIYLLL